MNFPSEVRAQACDSGLPTPHLKRRDKRGEGWGLLGGGTPRIKPPKTSQHLLFPPNLHRLPAVDWVPLYTSSRQLTQTHKNKGGKIDKLLMCQSCWCIKHNTGFPVRLFTHVWFALNLGHRRAFGGITLLQFLYLFIFPSALLSLGFVFPWCFYAPDISVVFELQRLVD